ncbi:MAG: Rieske 2Fe-2S domain-containing protein [Opitutaceae bacterium]|nr:Rieske 2Fe-2S domain-containing protein [Opitutaceae bacterium]
MPSTGHDVGAAGEFQDGKPRRFELNGRAVVVVRKGGEFFAMRDGCPHAGASLAAGRVTGMPLPCRPGEEAEYGREGEIISCPWHGWSFDLRNGCSITQPERYRAKSYRVEVRDGRVLVVAA